MRNLHGIVLEMGDNLVIGNQVFGLNFEHKFDLDEVLSPTGVQATSYLRWPVCTSLNQFRRDRNGYVVNACAMKFLPMTLLDGLQWYYVGNAAVRFDGQRLVKQAATWVDNQPCQIINQTANTICTYDGYVARWLNYDLTTKTTLDYPLIVGSEVYNSKGSFKYVDGVAQASGLTAFGTDRVLAANVKRADGSLVGMGMVTSGANTLITARFNTVASAVDQTLETDPNIYKNARLDACFFEDGGQLYVTYMVFDRSETQLTYVPPSYKSRCFKTASVGATAATIITDDTVKIPAGAFVTCALFEGTDRLHVGLHTGKYLLFKRAGTTWTLAYRQLDYAEPIMSIGVLANGNVIAESQFGAMTFIVPEKAYTADVVWGTQVGGVIPLTVKAYENGVAVQRDVRVYLSGDAVFANGLSNIRVTAQTTGTVLPVTAYNGTIKATVEVL